MKPRALVLSALALGTGSGLRALYLARALERAGWEVAFATPCRKPLPFSLESVLGAPRLLAAAFGRFDLALAVKPYPDAWAALALARLRGATSVIDVDDDDGAYRGPLLAGLTRLLQAPAFALASFISSHHPLLLKRLAERHGPEKVLKLPQGVDLSVFSPRTKLGGVQLAFTAHLNVACQLDLLLKAVGPWLQSHPEARLLVAGGGPDEARFRRLAEPLGGSVRFLGSVEPEQAASVLAESRVSLSAYGPSAGNRTRVPMKVAESLAVGTPVVTNLIPGLEPLRPYLYESGLDPEAFGAAVDQALGAEDGRTALGQAWVRRHLDYDAIVPCFLTELRDA